MKQILSFLLILASIAPLCAESSADEPANTKNLGPIWFIGDSITQSNADGSNTSSPRKSLYDILIKKGYNFSFTGASSANKDGLPDTGNTADTNLYQYHSGHTGSTIGKNSRGRANMTAGISKWWKRGRLAKFKPSIVLIMLGTNDIDLNDDTANAPERIKKLINTILAQVGPGDPVPAIYVAQIPPSRKNEAAAKRVIDFNKALPAVVASLVKEGKEVTLVDQFTRINANPDTLMKDALHTNTAGNHVLAEQWFNAISTHKTKAHE